jgi:nitrate reductase (NAD(P)H)
MSVKKTPILAKTIEAEEAAEKYHEFREQAEKGKLANLRDVINAQEDLHLRRLDVHSEGWKYDLNVRECYIKNEEEWLANLQ